MGHRKNHRKQRRHVCNEEGSEWSEQSYDESNRYDVDQWKYWIETEGIYKLDKGIHKDEGQKMSLMEIWKVILKYYQDSDRKG